MRDRRHHKRTEGGEVMSGKKITTTIRNNIFSDFMTGQYYQRELAKKYNVGVDSVRRVIQDKLRRKK